jgi:hypothetical protein
MSGVPSCLSPSVDVIASHHSCAGLSLAGASNTRKDLARESVGTLAIESEHQLTVEEFFGRCDESDLRRNSTH